MSGLPNIMCGVCGGDLTVVRDFWDNASILRPLVSVEVLPCASCLSRAASEAVEWALIEADEMKGEDDE